MTERAEPQRPSGPPRRALGRGTSRKRLVADRTARWVVVGGGFAIIASILGILVFILAEVWPLTQGATVREQLLIPKAADTDLVTDEYVSTALAIDRQARVRALSLPDGRELFQQRLVSGAPAPEVLEVRAEPRSRTLAASTAEGAVILAPYTFEVTFVGQQRTVTPKIEELIQLQIAPEGARLGPFSTARTRDGGLLVAAIYEEPGGQAQLVLVERDKEENLFTGEVTWTESRHEAPAPPDIDRLRMSTGHQLLVGSTRGGELLMWPLGGGVPGRPRLTPGKGSPITALELLLGGYSLVAGHADGTIEIWFPLREQDGEGRQLKLIREFPAHDGAITEIAPSWRSKAFLVTDEKGGLGFYHSTSHRTLWRGPSPAGEPGEMLFTPKADAVLISAPDGLHLLDVRAPHPDISLKSLFAKVWYESYPEPAYVWQSSSATDDFEPKLSLVPLLIGTLKGTIYSLLLAVPLGVFGAMYTSQFLHPGFKKVVKPTVEIMAALPSVVLGFLAGLWLAPRLEEGFTFLILLLVLIPLSVMIAGLGWFKLPQRIRAMAPTGAELFLYTAVIAAVGAVCLAISEPVELWLFDGSFPRWLLEATGTPYDQRNAIVVGLAMGFAVIPIIFSVSEDAFSNVPRDLVAGSLALGANRWQTVTRVVLPTASPGIFSAIMIGFGRAVGETMIVLMATGNTPIMDWNPFNGFRTLSANIAVEIPEAPVGGTLYRTLFMSALLLFVLTFLVNTVAEIVRHRLRRRYANL
jgi:phosphate transport system permease protein